MEEGFQAKRENS